MLPATGEWIIDGIDAQTASDFLKRHEPWRMELQFAGGPKASDFQTYQPFNKNPLNKLRLILQHIPEQAIANGRILDIGFNMGYNSLHLAKALACKATGIDIVPRHKSIADQLAKMLKVDAEFLIESAEDFERPGEFDLVLHLGTLYHLANPVRSIERCFRSLKKGAWFALETICYRGGDPNLCKWINGLGGDRTNFWALGEGAVRSIAGYSGISDLALIAESWPPVYNREMSRAIWVGRRSA